MRLLLVLSALLACTPLWSAGDDDFYSVYGQLLQKYVHDDRVDYAAWKNNQEDLSALKVHLRRMGQIRLELLNNAEKQAFFINLYNAAMLQAVLEDYPTESVTEILPAYGVFRQEFIQLGDQKVSLDHVEKDILLERWDDPRHHMAVNCASISCPPLRAEPYTGAKLETQLEEQTKLFANSFHAAQVDRGNRVVYVSLLFDWYADDFPGKTPMHWLNYFREKRLPVGYEVKFIEYDWSLNESQPEEE